MLLVFFVQEKHSRAIACLSALVRAGILSIYILELRFIANEFVYMLQTSKCGKLGSLLYYQGWPDDEVVNPIDYIGKNNNETLCDKIVSLV